MSDERLPRNARDIIDRLGPAVTLRLIRALGGTTIPVPMRLTPVGEARYRRLCDMIGEDVAKALCREYAGTNLYIPTCRQAAADERAGRPASAGEGTKASTEDRTPGSAAQEALLGLVHVRAANGPENQRADQKYG